MKYEREYGEAFIALSKRMGAEYPETPYLAIEEWTDLVEQIKSGYQSIQSELENDLELIREPIETFLVDPYLNQFIDHQEFKRQIENLDKEFLSISFEHPNWNKNENFKWWSNRILKYGSKEYADFLNAHFDKNLGILIGIV